MKPTMIDRRRYWRSNSRGSQTTQLRSLKVPDEYSQLAERGAEFASRLLLQQNRSYRRELLVARETFVVPGIIDTILDKTSFGKKMPEHKRYIE